MIVVLALCWGLAWMLQGAVSQAARDGRAAVRAGAGKARSRLVETRENGSKPGRVAASLALGAGYVAGGVTRGVLGTGRSLWLGGRDGWRRGRRRGLVAASRARRRKREKAAPVVGENVAARPAEKPAAGETETPRERAGSEKPDETPSETQGESENETPGETTSEKPDGENENENVSRLVSPVPVGYPAPPGTPIAPLDLDHLSNGGTPMTTIGSGESNSYAGTQANIDSIDTAATLHLDTAGSVAAEAEDIFRAAQQMQADLLAADMDDDTNAAVSALMEAAKVHQENAEATKASAERLGAAARNVRGGLDSHARVAEAVQSHPHAAQTGYYRNGR